MSKVNIIETVAKPAKIDPKRGILSASLAKIVQRAKKELGIKRLYVSDFCFLLEESISRWPFVHRMIKQRKRFYWRKLKTDTFFLTARIKLNGKKVIVEVYKRAILEIVEEELSTATEKMGINDLVIIKYFD